MSGFNASLWLDVYEYCYAMGRKAFPNDEPAAYEVASDCFDRYVRLYGACGLDNYKAWIGRSIAGLRKNYLRQQWQYGLTGDETDDALERLRPPQLSQDVLVDVKWWRRRIEQLETRQRDAFRIIAEGGNVKDVMDELGIGPREALLIIEDARRELWNGIPPEQRAA